MGACSEHACALFICHKAAEGQAPGDALGKAHDVRLNAVLHEGEQAACPSHAGLHLVDEEQQVLFPAEPRHLLHEIVGPGQHAAHALYHSIITGACPVCDGVPDTVDVVGPGVVKALVRENNL